MENTLYSVEGTLNRRVHLRNECSIDIEMEDTLENVYHGRVVNISPGGAYILAGRATLRKNQKVSLTIPFQKKDGAVTVDAKVAWIGPEGYGVAFVRNFKD